MTLSGPTHGPTVAIVGVGYSEITRRSPRPLVLLARDAVTRAVVDAGLELSSIDGISTYPVLAPFHTPDIDIINIPSMMEALQLEGQVRWYCEPHEGMIGGAVVAAYHALRSGACKYALVWRALHMPAAGRYNQPPDTVAVDAQQFTVPYGFAGLGGSFSAIFTRYLSRYDGTREKLATIATNSRAFANLNPDAYFNSTPLTIDEYMSARMLTDSMCVYDCDVPVDGACAIVMTTADRAADLDVKPAYLRTIVQGGPAPSELWDLEGAQRSMHLLGDRLWNESGLCPEDMGAAMLYDGFSIFPVLWLEGLGYCADGEALDFIQGGRIGLGGQLPVNTFGGGLSQGRLHGLGHVIEAALQVSGRAGSRQVENVQHVVATIALNLTGAAMVISAET